jgi:glycosyltransferase involved in cell wall biosynthesis
MLLDTLVPGGAERVAVEVACALDPDRFEPFFVVSRLGGPLEAALDEAGVPYRILGRKGRSIPVRAFADARRSFASADLIHAHMFGSSIWGALFSRATGVPLITRDPTWSGTRTAARTYAYRYWIGPTARRIICPSAPVADSILAEGVAPDKLTVITNGVPLGAAVPRSDARRELHLAADAWVIGIIAHLREEKAHEVLIRAFARVLASGRRSTLCIVGDGPRRPALEALAVRLGVNSHIVWAGSHRDARRLAGAFDAAVICSNWEGLPLAALEVLAAGTPLVATRVGVLPTVLDEGAGMLVDVGDDEQLAAALISLLDSPEAAADLSARAIARVEDRYRFERMVEEFAAVYEDVLAER